ncbi:hypothetical protein F8388_026272 [Cannabis sativa]|uniref:RNase H type-1 domain-containing protein n=1 Tax=Cannabis sativa TaxID=3483 RepID=A0A7J6EYZ3_CANSA|nr:hypothetical protein F8388_026272 [Cannabis sativa]
MYWRFCGFENENSKDEISSSWLWFRGCVCWTVRVLESEDGSERENFRGAYRQWGMTVGGGGQWLARLGFGDGSVGLLGHTLKHKSSLYFLPRLTILLRRVDRRKIKVIECKNKEKKKKIAASYTSSFMLHSLDFSSSNIRWHQGSLTNDKTCLFHLRCLKIQGVDTDATANILWRICSLGATIKNCHNQAIADFSIPKLGASTPLFAEAQALLEGLNWCAAIDLQPSLIMSNCSQLVTNVRSKWKDKSALSILVELIRESLSYFPNASLQHIPRTDNREAHQNARDALQRDKDFTMRV